jgi:hypothetical protein
MRPDAPQGGSPNSFRTAGGVVATLCKTAGAPVETILHRNFGPRHFGVPAAAAILLIPFWSVFWPHDDCRPLLGFLLAYLVMCLFARLGIFWRGLRGRHAHSRYNGTPRICRLLPRLDEVQIKLYVEPVLVFLAGVLLLAITPPLGSFLMFSAFGLFASVAMVEAYQRQRTMDLHDAYLDQHAFADSFRRVRQD